MAVPRNNLNVNFAQGLDTKTDPFQLAPGKMLALQNTVFNKGGRLQKRNGYGTLASLPNASSTFLTTFKDNLTAIGTSLSAYSSGANTWVNKGMIQPVSLDVTSLIRSNTNQSFADSVTSGNGFTCTVFTDNVPSGGSNVLTYKYVISDSTTGQNIVAPVVIPTTGTILYSPRVFLLGNYFILVFNSSIAAVNHIQYVAINITTPTSVVAATDITTTSSPAATGTFDGIVVNNSLYLAWAGSGTTIKMNRLDSTLSLHTVKSFAAQAATLVSVCADTSSTSPIIYVFYYNLGTTAGKVLAVSPTGASLAQVLAPTSVLAAGTILNVTATATAGVCTLFYEKQNAYAYDAASFTNIIVKNTITQAGVVGTPANLIRSVGLASKAIMYSGTTYFLATYSSSYQPTYFLMNSSGQVVAKLAYSNGGGYLVTSLPTPQVDGVTIKIPYLIKDLVAAVNKTQGAAISTGVYSQTGINLATFTMSGEPISASDIGNNLHISGGFLWLYDGYLPVEHSFHLWPDLAPAAISVSHSGGSMTTQDYYYQATYEWSDNQGNVHRSAPSVPTIAPTASFSGSSNSVTVSIPTLRLTYKTANPVKLVLYRWSTAQQTYYQVTSLTIPTLNDTTADVVAYLDTLADSSIIGNNVLYTTGGVLENIAAPATNTTALFDTRLFYIDAEDQNLLGYSKQVIQTTPVETSDLLTIYVSPTAGAQGNTGPMRCLAPLDDKLAIFKKDAIYYINGRGPDNTGANSQYSEPTFITATVGCENQNSIVFQPSGLMFQSDKGIWLLGRDLSTKYIGAPVEEFTKDSLVQSAVNVPATNQIRFTLDSGVTLMYDYYYDQWGTFNNVSAVSSTIYQGLHTYINALGAAYQETPDLYLDGSSPVLISFTTGWFNLAGLQGFERACEFYLLGTYLSPHKLTVSIAYDYSSSPQQTTVISPLNYNPTYGSDPIYGASSYSNVYGGNTNIEQWRIFFKQQKCQAFQITITESYDATFGVPAGAGFTLSGLDLTVAAKSGKPRLRAAQQAG